MIVTVVSMPTKGHLAKHNCCRVVHMAMVTLMSTCAAACESVLLQGDAFTFGSAESIPRSARRRSVIPTGKGQLANPGNPPNDIGKQSLSDPGNHDTVRPL